MTSHPRSDDPPDDPLTASQFPGTAAIRDQQLAALDELLSEMRPGNRFYAEKLNRAGVPQRLESLEQFSALVDFTDKQHLSDDQLANPPYGTNLSYPLEAYTRVHQTSGTSGVILRWLDTSESWSWMLEAWCKVYRNAGIVADDRVFFAFSYGPFLGFWTAFEAAVRLQCLAIPGGGMSNLARLQSIRDNNVTVVCCTPSYALRLAEVAREENVDFGTLSVRRLIVGGEPGGSVPEIRARIEAAWKGARVVDHHGMTEVGPVTHECPETPGQLHVMEAHYYPEIIDPGTGHATPDGEIGELVLTTLGRHGSPLLRYRTGDLGRPRREQPCRCGRYTLALEGGILARCDDMVVVRGVNLYPSAVESVIRATGDVVEYRVEIREHKEMAEISVFAELGSGVTESAQVIHQLEESLRATFGLRVPVQEAPAGSLPRFELKAKRWVRVSED